MGVAGPRPGWPLPASSCSSDSETSTTHRHSCRSSLQRCRRGSRPAANKQEDTDGQPTNFLTLGQRRWIEKGPARYFGSQMHLLRSLKTRVQWPGLTKAEGGRLTLTCPDLLMQWCGTPRPQCKLFKNFSKSVHLPAECEGTQGQAGAGSPLRKSWWSAGTRNLRAISGISPSLGLPHSPAKVLLTRHLGEDQVKKRMGQEESTTCILLVAPSDH